MSTGRIGPAILAALINDSTTLLAIRTDKEGVITVFSPDELLTPCPEAVADFWRQLAEQERNKRDAAEEALKIALARSGGQANGAAEPGPEPGPEPTNLREQATNSAGEVPCKQEGASNYQNYYGDQIRIKSDPAAGAALGPVSLDDKLTVHGEYVGTAFEIAQRAQQALISRHTLRIGTVGGFGQVAIVGESGSVPFSELPSGRYIYFPES